MFERITTRQVFERYLTEAEEKQLMRHIGSVDSPFAKRDLHWMTLARQTGLRIGSIAGLTVGDANEAIRTRHLTVRDEIAKGGRGYSVLVNSSAEKALRALLKLRTAMQLSQAPDEALIWSRQGARMTTRQFQLRMKHWCAEAKLSIAASPHWLRHTLAKRLIARSTSTNPLGIVQAVLGQRSVNSTAVYTLPDREAVAADLEAAR